jgi:hypothetical protein
MAPHIPANAATKSGRWRRRIRMASPLGQRWCASSPEDRPPRGVARQPIGRRDVVGPGAIPQATKRRRRALLANGPGDEGPLGNRADRARGGLHREHIPAGLHEDQVTGGFLERGCLLRVHLISWAHTVVRTSRTLEACLASWSAWVRAMILCCRRTSVLLLADQRCHPRPRSAPASSAATTDQ